MASFALRLADPVTGHALVAAALQACVDQVQANADIVARGDFDDEHVHQLRVGLRRLRVALRELGGLAPLAQAAWCEALDETYRGLGAYRDATWVQPALWQRMNGGEPMAVPAVRAAADPRRLARSRRLNAVLRAIRRWIDEARGARDTIAAQAARAELAARLQPLYREAVRKGPRFTTLAEPQQHRLRRRVKRLRHLCEFARPLFAARQVDRFIARLARIERVLGDYQDLVVARRAWAPQAARDRQAWFAANWLLAHLPAASDLCRHACVRFAHRARPFWN